MVARICTGIWKAACPCPFSPHAVSFCFEGIIKVLKPESGDILRQEQPGARWEQTQPPGSHPSAAEIPQWTANTVSGW